MTIKLYVIFNRYPYKFEIGASNFTLNSAGRTFTDKTNQSDCDKMGIRNGSS